LAWPDWIVIFLGTQNNLCAESSEVWDDYRVFLWGKVCMFL